MQSPHSVRMQCRTFFNSVLLINDFDKLAAVYIRYHVVIFSFLSYWCRPHNSKQIQLCCLVEANKRVSCSRCLLGLLNKWKANTNAVTNGHFQTATSADARSIHALAHTMWLMKWASIDSRAMSYPDYQTGRSPNASIAGHNNKIIANDQEWHTLERTNPKQI